jgi:hypothetical protein
MLDYPCRVRRRVKRRIGLMLGNRWTRVPPCLWAQNGKQRPTGCGFVRGCIRVHHTDKTTGCRFVLTNQPLEITMINIKHSGQHTVAVRSNQTIVAPATGTEAAYRAMRMLVIAYAGGRWCTAPNVTVRFKQPRTQFITLH